DRVLVTLFVAVRGFLDAFGETADRVAVVVELALHLLAALDHDRAEGLSDHAPQSDVPDAAAHHLGGVLQVRLEFAEMFPKRRQRITFDLEPGHHGLPSASSSSSSPRRGRRVAGGGGATAGGGDAWLPASSSSARAGSSSANLLWSTSSSGSSSGGRNERTRSVDSPAPLMTANESATLRAVCFCASRTVSMIAAVSLAGPSSHALAPSWRSRSA